MMKLKYPLILAIFLILAAVTVAGCCCCSSTPSFQGATSFSFGSSATAIPTKSTTSGGSTLGSLVDFNKVHWYEYEMTSDSAGTAFTMTMREDFNVDYQGKTSNKVTVNMNMGAGDSTMNMISYTDPSTGATLGGHMKMTAGGNTIMDQDLEPGEKPSAAPSVSTENPLTSFEGTVTMSGTESVTVPAGTYTATKYTWNKGSDTGYVWVAPNVPIPVKMTYSAADTSVDMKLTGWG